MVIKFQVKLIILFIWFFVSNEVKSDQETQNKEDNKRFACIEKYINKDLEKGEKQIIYRACERLISKNEKKQKIAKCTLKEIGKHSLPVLIVKQNNLTIELFSSDLISIWWQNWLFKNSSLSIGRGSKRIFLMKGLLNPPIIIWKKEMIIKKNVRYMYLFKKVLFFIFPIFTF